MTKNQFTNLIRNCKSDLFTEITVEKDSVLIPVTRIRNSKNDGMICFLNADKKVATAINKRDISDVEQLNTSRDDYDYSLLIITKNGKSIKVHINMKDGYSLYAYTDDVIGEYKAVAEAIPKYLDKFKGKTVTVLHSTNTAMYRTFSEEVDGDVLPVTDSYIIHNFDYCIYYDGVAPNIPCIKMYSKENRNIYACAMGVDLILDRAIFTADGEYVIKEV